MTRNPYPGLSQHISAPFHSKGVSKLYLFSSNKPSSIALISVEKKMSCCQLGHETGACGSIHQRKTYAAQCASSGIGTRQNFLHCVEHRYFFPSKKEKGLPVMHQRRGSPISRHAPCISPSASKPQIGLRRAPASGPSILRIGSRASPRLRICVVNHQSVTVTMEIIIIK
jgi:hypothetical protein